jgi:hypothetical protein
MGSRGSSVSIVTGLRVGWFGVRISGSENIFCCSSIVQTDPRAYLVFYPLGARGSFFGCKLAHHHLAPNLRMSGAKPSLILCAVMAWEGATSRSYFTPI